MLCVVLQMESRTRVHLKGIIKDVLINFCKFIIPVDFPILNYDAHDSVPIILGHEFFTMGQVLID